MPERCKHCEEYEKRQRDARERRVRLWRGELTDAAAEKLTSEE